MFRRQRKKIKEEAAAEATGQASAMAKAEARLAVLDALRDFRDEMARTEATKEKVDQDAWQDELRKCGLAEQGLLSGLSADDRSMVEEILAGVNSSMMPQFDEILQRLQAKQEPTSPVGSETSASSSQTEEVASIPASIEEAFGLGDELEELLHEQTKTAAAKTSAELAKIIKIWCEVSDKNYLLVKDLQQDRWYFAQKNITGQVKRQGYIDQLERGHLPEFIRALLEPRGSRDQAVATEMKTTSTQQSPKAFTPRHEHEKELLELQKQLFFGQKQDMAVPQQRDLIEQMSKIQSKLGIN